MKGHVQNIKAGQSFYHNYGGNKSNPQSLPRVAAALDMAREQSSIVPAVIPDPIQNQPTQQAPVTLPTSPKALAEHAEQQPTPAPTVNLGSSSTTKLISPSMPYLPVRAPAIKLPAQPAVAQRLNTPSSPAPTSSSDDSMTQNVSDRQLAHLITGGLGMGGQVG